MTISLFNAERLDKGRNYVIGIGDKAYLGVLYEDYRITEVYRKDAHAYGMRHPDDSWCEPATISPSYPLVNFFGTFITKCPIPITEETDIDWWDEVSPYELEDFDTEEEFLEWKRKWVEEDEYPDYPERHPDELFESGEVIIIP